VRRGPRLLGVHGVTRRGGCQLGVHPGRLRGAGRRGGKATKEQVEGFWGPPETSLYQCSRLERLAISFQMPEGGPNVRVCASAYLTCLRSLRTLVMCADTYLGKPYHGIYVPDLSALTRLTGLALYASDTLTGPLPAGCRLKTSASTFGYFKFDDRYRDTIFEPILS
jgi:hypothetical protein